MRQWAVDAFATEPFKGNPACVVEPFDAWPADAWMQALAAENNQAETAYLLKTADPARFGLRWFTPAMEVRLCGHATLASAHVLLSELGATVATLTFDTLSGPLAVGRAGRGYEMDFPADPPSPCAAPEGLVEALGAPVTQMLKGAFYVALLGSEGEVRGLRPDLAAVARTAGNVVVSALADPGRPYQVVSRVFAPAAGIPEDPATGSAHCVLAPLFSQRLGRAVVSYHQAYPGRGGDMDCEVRGDRVLLRGGALTMVEGQLRFGAG